MKNTHVIRNPKGGWSVKQEGASRASGIYETKKEAISKGSKISRTTGSELIIHDKAGRTTSIQSFHVTSDTPTVYVSHKSMSSKSSDTAMYDKKDRTKQKPRSK